MAPVTRTDAVEADPVEWRPGAALNELVQIYRLKDWMVGQRIGLTRQNVQSRRACETRISSGELYRLAEAFDYELELFYKTPVEIRLIVADRDPELERRARFLPPPDAGVGVVTRKYRHRPSEQAVRPARAA